MIQVLRKKRIAIKCIITVMPTIAIRTIVLDQPTHRRYIIDLLPALFREVTATRRIAQTGQHGIPIHRLRWTVGPPLDRLRPVATAMESRTIRVTAADRNTLPVHRLWGRCYFPTERKLPLGRRAVPRPPQAVAVGAVWFTAVAIRTMIPTVHIKNSRPISISVSQLIWNMLLISNTHPPTAWQINPNQRRKIRGHSIQQQVITLHNVRDYESK